MTYPLIVLALDPLLTSTATLKVNKSSYFLRLVFTWSKHILIKHLSINIIISYHQNYCWIFPSLNSPIYSSLSNVTLCTVRCLLSFFDGVIILLLMFTLLVLFFFFLFFCCCFACFFSIVTQGFRRTQIKNTMSQSLNVEEITVLFNFKIFFEIVFIRIAQRFKSVFQIIR